MAKRRGVLGNDPFERGAAHRPELEEGVPPIVRAGGDEPRPPEPRPASRRKRVARTELQRPEAEATEDVEAEVAREPTTEAPTEPEPARTVAAEADGSPQTAPSSEPADEPTEAVEETETAAGRLRELLEQRLPALAERLARATSETLGLLSPPREVPGVDPYGMSAEFFQRWQPLLALALDRYFRLVTEGLERIPLEGPALLVCNHSGVLPFDEVVLESAIAARHPAHRIARPLTEDFAIHFPFAGSWLNRFGCVRACPENAERLLSEGHLVAVFPEGSHGIGKLYRNRYRLQRFGRGGFVRVALRAQVPIVPIAILGAEEAHPVLARIDLPRGLGLPYLPITPTFPWLGPLGLWPLPARLHLEVGEPIRFDRPPRDAEDRPLVARLAEEVRARVQELLDGLLSKRHSVFR